VPIAAFSVALERWLEPGHPRAWLLRGEKWWCPTTAAVAWPELRVFVKCFLAWLRGWWLWCQGREEGRPAFCWAHARLCCVSAKTGGSWSCAQLFYNIFASKEVNRRSRVSEMHGWKRLSHAKLCWRQRGFFCIAARPGINERAVVLNT